MKVCSFMHLRNASSESAARLGAQRQEERGKRGKRKAGGRTEGGREEGWDREPPNGILGTREGRGAAQGWGERDRNGGQRGGGAGAQEPQEEREGAIKKRGQGAGEREGRDRAGQEGQTHRGGQVSGH